MIEFIPQDPVKAENLEKLLGEVERRVILSVVRATGGNVSEAGRVLGLSRSGTYKALARHDIEIEPTEPAQ